MNNFVTLTTFAKLTGFNERTIRTWCQRGKLLANQPGGYSGQWHIHVSELEKYKPKLPIKPN